MKKTIFSGVATALVTPMREDGSVNYSRLAELVEWQIAEGVNALVACGTTGESATLNHEEHVKVIETVIAAAAKRVPVIAGTGSNDTAYAVELSKEAERLGADALLLVTPYYNKTSQAGLITHYQYIADRVNSPIILYNVPSRTGTNIAPATYEALSHHENIVAVKEANGDFSALMKTIQLCEGRLDIYSGNDDQVLPMMSLGGKGVISVFSNLAPAISSKMCRLYLSGEREEALRMQMKYLDVMNDLFLDVNPIPVKEAMNLAGMQVGPCRLPLVATSSEKQEMIGESMRSAGLLAD